MKSLPCYCCSVAKLCLTVCNSVDYSTSGFRVLHYLLKFAQIHVHWVGDDNHSSSAALFSFYFQSCPASRYLPMSWLFTSGGQSIGTSTSVLPMNIQGWFPLGLIDLISLLSKRLSRVFSSTTILEHQFFGTQPSLWTNFHICTQFGLYKILLNFKTSSDSCQKIILRYPCLSYW